MAHGLLHFSATQALIKPCFTVLDHFGPNNLKCNL